MKKFTLYIGLNDKDTKKQEITTKNARQLINYILLNFVDGATITQSEGIYKHTDNETVIENTFKIELLFVEEKTVKKIVEMLKEALNQESIAVQIEEIESYLW